MSDSSKAANYFVRTLIGLLCLLLAAMVLFRYITVQPQGEISPGLLTLVGLLVVLVLAESFDNFSVGKLVSVSRDVRKKEVEIDKLEKQNASLLSQLITVSKRSVAKTKQHNGARGLLRGGSNGEESFWSRS